MGSFDRQAVGFRRESITTIKHQAPESNCNPCPAAVVLVPRTLASSTYCMGVMHDQFLGNLFVISLTWLSSVIEAPY